MFVIAIHSSTCVTQDEYLLDMLYNQNESGGTGVTKRKRGNAISRVTRVSLACKI